jgi:hypothetical protein
MKSKAYFELLSTRLWFAHMRERQELAFMAWRDSAYRDTYAHEQYRHYAKQAQSILIPARAMKAEGYNV